MSWTGDIDGPVPAPILGPPNEEGVREVLGEAPGYRLNITPALMAPALDAFRVTPAAPMRTWAGDEPPWEQTVFLLFADEAEARTSALGAFWIGE
jgi:hypothetical protein